MSAYVHDLTVNKLGYVHSPDARVVSSSYTGSEGHLCIEPSWDKGLPGLVPFVYCRPGAYGRLLLAVYVRWRTCLLVSSDWLRPVMRKVFSPMDGNPGSLARCPPSGRIRGRRGRPAVPRGRPLAGSSVSGL